MAANHGVIRSQNGRCPNQRDETHLRKLFHFVIPRFSFGLTCSLYYEADDELDDTIAGFLELSKIACYHFEIAALRFCQFLKAGGIDAFKATPLLLGRRAGHRRVDGASRFRICRGYASAEID